MKSSRHHTREKVLQVLYAYQLSGDPIEKVIKDLLTEVKDKENVAFAHKIITHVIENDIRFDELARSAIDNWDIERIALIDLIIIKMCLTELFFFEDIPPKVSINEAIELAKEFSTRNSSKFVNGVLDALHLRLTKSGEIRKSGKGLITSSEKSVS
jgi:N utilization substance protein B